MMGKKWIGHARLFAEVPSTSIEYCEVYKIPKKAGSLWVPWFWVLDPWVHCLYLLQTVFLRLHPFSFDS